MPHEANLIATVAVGLVLAFAFGFVAAKLHLPPLIGYLVAGIAVGPFTPGFVADAGLAGQLAEIGVILLMFGVGLHFSAADLMAVRWIAVPGAVGQIALATLFGVGIAAAWGWDFGAGLVFGLCLSVASTVVLLKALEERNSVDTVNGRIAVGWLIVEDLAMVLALVLLPAFAEALGGHADTHGAEAAAETDLLTTLAITLAKVSAFVAIVLLVGPRVVPWILGQVARTGSRELFTLSVLAVALGIAYGSAELFGVSFALGAFFAGVVLNESDFSHKAAAESLPLQDAFAVLFFVSVGMLFDPYIVVREPLAVIVVLLLITLGKSLIAFLIVLALRFPAHTALTVSASLAQIGEFSFILAGLGIAMGLLPTEGRDLVLAGALLSITLNPVMFAAVAPALRRLDTPAMARQWWGRFGQARYSALEGQLAEARRRAEAREAERVVQAQELAERFPMFAGLSPEDRQDLLSIFRHRKMSAGQRVIRKGERADAVYFVSSGAVEVSVPGRKIRLGPGDHFGEMALLSGGPRSADVTAIDYGELYTLDRRDFLRFIGKHPRLKAAFDETAAKRREMNERMLDGGAEQA